MAGAAIAPLIKATDDTGAGADDIYAFTYSDDSDFAFEYTLEHFFGGNLAAWEAAGGPIANLDTGTLPTIAPQTFLPSGPRPSGGVPILDPPTFVGGDLPQRPRFSSTQSSGDSFTGYVDRFRGQLEVVPEVGTLLRFSRQFALSPERIARLGEQIGEALGEKIIRGIRGQKMANTQTIPSVFQPQLTPSGRPGLIQRIVGQFGKPRASSTRIRSQQEDCCKKCCGGGDNPVEKALKDRDRKKPSTRRILKRIADKSDCVWRCIKVGSSRHPMAKDPYDQALLDSLPPNSALARRLVRGGPVSRRHHTHRGGPKRKLSAAQLEHLRQLRQQYHLGEYR